MTIHAVRMGHFTGADLDMPRVSEPQKHFTNGYRCALCGAPRTNGSLRYCGWCELHLGRRIRRITRAQMDAFVDLLAARAEGQDVGTVRVWERDNR